MQGSSIIINIIIIGIKAVSYLFKRRPASWVSRVNLLVTTCATTHISLFLPCITDSKAPFTFVTQVSEGCEVGEVLALLFASLDLQAQGRAGQQHSCSGGQ